MTPQDIHSPDEHPHIREIFDQMATRTLESHPDIPLLRKDGSIFPASIYSSILELEETHISLGSFRILPNR